MKLTLRLVTVICYFLPFTFFLTTCNNGLELRFSYNQTEADTNIFLEKESIEVAVTDTTHYQRPISVESPKTNISTKTHLTDTEKATSDTLQKSADYRDKILRKMLFPTKTSMSGIGSILYFKNLTGQIAITICLLISLILLIAFRFLKSNKTKQHLLLTAVLCLSIFIVDSFISSVTLLWGSWTLLLLLILQLIIEYKGRQKAYR